MHYYYYVPSVTSKNKYFLFENNPQNLLVTKKSRWFANEAVKVNDTFEMCRLAAHRDRILQEIWIKEDEEISALGRLVVGVWVNVNFRGYPTVGSRKSNIQPPSIIAYRTVRGLRSFWWLLCWQDSEILYSLWCERSYKDSRKIEERSKCRRNIKADLM